MKEIDITQITPKRELIIEKGILSYNYLREYYNPNNKDFKEVFTDFYLKSQFTMRNKENNEAFFKIMDGCNPNEDTLEMIVTKIKNSVIDMYEFSFATKLLHTVCVAKDVKPGPIYDRKVRDYTQDVLNEIKYSFSPSIKKEKKKDAINRDWKELQEWYIRFLSSETGEEWINWFNDKFPKAKDISDVKKVDFIIYACIE